MNRPIPFAPDQPTPTLAAYAQSAERSRGRVYPEPEHAWRNPYQRDRDRILHANAFRRLAGKTQMLTTQTNDHHRTRLTHTLEVSQLARTVARCLGLNEDLTEAIALSHDLGHPPFGHAGEAALNACMADVGGFEHNLHGLRRVDWLESCYPHFPGLNLTFEVREAMAQHSCRRDHPTITALLVGGTPLLEAQVVDACDSLAYDTHDLADALEEGLIDLDDLATLELWQAAAAVVRRAAPTCSVAQFPAAVVRVMIDQQVSDLVTQTSQRLQSLGIRTLDDVRCASAVCVAHSPELARGKAELERFLRQRVYGHPRVKAMSQRGGDIVRELFERYRAAPHHLDPAQPNRGDAPAATTADDTTSLTQRIADHIAAMTDHRATQELARLRSNDSGLD